MSKRKSATTAYTLEEAALALRRVYAQHFERVRSEAASVRRASARRWKLGAQST